MELHAISNLSDTFLRVREGKASANQVLAPIIVDTNPPIILLLAPIDEEEIAVAPCEYWVAISMISGNLNIPAIEEPSGHVADVPWKTLERHDTNYVLLSGILASVARTEQASILEQAACVNLDHGGPSICMRPVLRSFSPHPILVA